MFPIPIIWSTHSAIIRGSIVKFVRCENCSTEYLYLMEREGTGMGTSLYLLNEQGAANRAGEAAKEMLKAILEKDFDAVPCPVCGHYQRYMFSKLERHEVQQPKGLWGQALLLAGIAAGSLAGVVALRSTLAYALGPNKHDLWNSLAAWSVVLLGCLLGFGPSVVRRYRSGRCNPNSGDPQVRIAMGQTRAVTREEYEQARRSEKVGDRVSRILKLERAEPETPASRAYHDGSSE